MARRRGQGEGSLEELPSGKWRALYTNGKTREGRQRKVTATFDTRKEAAYWLNEQLDAKRKGRLCEPTRMTLDVWLKQWIRSMKTKGLSASTLQYYSDYVTNQLIPELGDAELGQLTPLLIQQGFDRMAEAGLSANQRHRALMTLRIALNASVKMRLIYTNPAKDVEQVKVSPREMSPWTAAEARSFLASIEGQRLEALFVLALDTGMRQGELLGLHWNDVDLVAGTVYVRYSLGEVHAKHTLKAPKTKKGLRKIWISATAVKALQRHRERMWAEKRNAATGPEFVNRRGKWLVKGHLSVLFRRLVAESGVRAIRFHDMRHTNATMLLASGVGLKTVSERLGHESVEITLRVYCHSLSGEHEAIGNVVERLLSHSNPINAKKCTEVHSCIIDAN